MHIGHASNHAACTSESASLYLGINVGALGSLEGQPVSIDGRFV